MVWDIITVVLLVITIFLLLWIVIKKNKFNIVDDSSKTDLSLLESNLSSSLYKDFSQISLTLSKLIGDMRTDLTKSLGDSKNESNEALIKTQGDIQKRFGEFQVIFEQRINKAFQEINESIEKRLQSINDRVDERLNTGFEKTNESFNKIAQTVSRIEEAKQTMIQLTDEVNDLQNILSNNQMRGAFGEYQLNQILSNIFGEFQGKMYDVQYKLASNDGEVKADAVIFLKPQNLILCIDSKFPYGSYAQYCETRFASDSEENKAITAIKNDVKKHIDAISLKYIVPGTTLDYALMFIPSDGLLAFLHAKIPQIIEYATEKRVVIVSPTVAIPTLLSCKTMIIDSMKAEKLREINEVLIALSKEFSAFSDIWRRLNKNLDTIHKQSKDFNIKVNKISKKFNRIQASEIEEKEYEEIEYEENIGEDDEI